MPHLVFAWSNATCRALLGGQSVNLSAARMKLEWYGHSTLWHWTVREGAVSCIKSHGDVQQKNNECSGQSSHELRQESK